MSKEPKAQEEDIVIKAQEEWQRKIRTGEKWTDGVAQKVRFPEPWPERPPKQPPASRTVRAETTEGATTETQRDGQDGNKEK
jgi:hypothetical protein